MHVIIIGSYMAAAAMFLVATVLLAVSWRGQRIGALLILATAVSMLWAGFVAYAEWQRALAIHWLLLAEVLRYGAWLAFVSALFGAAKVLRGLRAVTHGTWALLALYCLWPAGALALGAPAPFRIDVPLVGVLLLALIGVVFLEQILRNTDPERRWALKFLLIALVGMFAYDIFLYSYAILYHQFSTSAWAARGFVNALLAPLLLVAAARNRKWSLDVGVSRRMVFYSTSLLVVACYIIAIAAGGYYVRMYGGDWGRVAEIAFVCLALLLVFMIASSGQARSRLKSFLHKNFFSFRHDYREQWLRLTATLAASDSDTELPLRAVRAVAQTMDSPAGALFTRDDTDSFVPQAEWNMPIPDGLKLAATAPVFEFMCERRWIYDLGSVPPMRDQRLRAPAALSALPHAWLLVPLVLEDRLIGLVVLAHARARRTVDWEDIDLLRTAGSQIAGTLMQATNARELAEARQFEGFNRLTAFLMHDLKNVVAQQSLLLQNAARHKHNPAFVDDMLATVDNSVHRITRLLDQLRGESKPAVWGRVRLATVIDKALDECRTHLPLPGCQLSTAESWVRADAEQLATVLVHLVRNAQDAATAGGHVMLRLKHAAGQVVLEIADDGDGMDDEFIRQRLFKPFFTTKGSRGMGIGAYQAREYVRLLGGTLCVDSTPGQGTVFTITLPLAEPVADDLNIGKQKVMAS
ncbi:MAG TPA: XrtA/PEP-CTERM system histidine kinase PrsK [Rhodanobacteraceae bacterium]|nr:XrtA/PEP-CTERM system histidine kinase PrsK [Rhodanobacteraceae bacterium]